MLRRIARGLVTLFFCGMLFADTTPGLWLDVPFVKQVKEGCGAASIAMVMQYWAQQQNRDPQSVDATEIQNTLYSKKGHGIYASDVESYFKEHGFRTFAFKGETADLKDHLQKGRPLMVALKPGKAPLHYVVVAGLDENNHVVIVNDPAQRKLLKLDQTSFEQEWNAAGKWTLLALPESGAR
ncbi:MAG TPA: C39 family peptidase [Terriglobales bacterium]|nr:C39 family peptidase [Terriglobales bacterium]